MLRLVVKHAFFLLAFGLLAASAHASYAQMRLEGLGLLLAFALTVAYGVIVDLALFARLFRHRTAVVVGSIIAVAMVVLLLSLATASSEWRGLFKGSLVGPGPVMLLVTSAVFLPFIVIAPFAQSLAMRQGRGWPGWIGAWMAVQLALPPGFIVLAVTDHYYRQQEYAAAEPEGREVKAGELGALFERPELKHERIWGTGWTFPRPLDGSSQRNEWGWRSGWISGLARGMDASALIATNEPLGEPDRAALQTLMERHFLIFGVPQIRTKLLWDTLEPGAFSRLLWDPHEPGDFSATLPRVSEEEFPVLLERLEKHGEARFCPGGRMLDADRAALNALVMKLGRTWNVETRDYEVRPPWDDYQRRAGQLCPGPG